MFAVTESDALGKMVHQFLPQYVDQTYIDGICRQGSGTPATENEEAKASAPEAAAFVGRRADGGEFPVEASVSCLTLGDHHVYTVIARDVTERQRAEEALRTQAVSLKQSAEELQALNNQLQQRQEELERAMSARSRFYASMSHELRTPINAILGYNTLMLENIYGPLNERQVHGLQRTQKAAKHLLELVNDVLDLSKIEAGKIEVQLQPVAIPALIQDLFITVKPLADERGSELTLEHTGDPISLITDPRRVRQILLNLLSNAIKFGRGNPIKVRSVPREDNGVEILVEDGGEGIPAGDLPRIFDEFVQLAHAHDHEGTGLGLPISKRLALLLNGRLEAESTVGEGSIFKLTLPKSADSSIRTPTPSQSQPGLTHPTPPRAVPVENPGALAAETATPGAVGETPADTTAEEIPAPPMTAEPHAGKSAETTQVPA